MITSGQNPKEKFFLKAKKHPLRALSSTAIGIANDLDGPANFYMFTPSKLEKHIKTVCLDFKIIQENDNQKEETKIHDKDDNMQSKNQILYGPPGTGKTYKLEKEYFKHFTESSQTQSKAEFLLDLVKGATWWQIIAAILLEKNG